MAKQLRSRFAARRRWLYVDITASWEVPMKSELRAEPQTEGHRPALPPNCAPVQATDSIGELATETQIQLSPQPHFEKTSC